MNYYSTRNIHLTVPLRQAVLQGIAPDGGLYMPSTIPALPGAFFKNISQMSYSEIAYIISNTFFGQDVDSEIIKQIVTQSINFDIPLVSVNNNHINVLELFHGPTLALNDLGARFMARLIHYFNPPNTPLNILVATSGDAGSAVAAGFHDIPGVHVFILYPSSKVSDIQEAQFTTLGRNITAIEIYGSFDDCQAMVTRASLDKDLTAKMALTSANSVNIARLLPQTIFFFLGYARMVENGANPDEIVISLPCGNLGTLTAAIIARRMGLPVKRLIAVNNTNGFFYNYLKTGDTTPVTTGASLTSAIDVARPSNIDRIINLYRGDRNAIARDITAVTVDDNRVINTINSVDSQYNYILEPHSAAAYAALCDNIADNESGLVLAVAHPAKFRNTVETAINRPLSIPDNVKDMLSHPRHRKRMQANFSLLKEYLLNHS